MKLKEIDGDPLKSQLETTKSEVTEAYKKAIKEAIETNNGVINAKIAEEIGKVNGLIEELNSKLAKLQIQVDKHFSAFYLLLLPVEMDRKRPAAVFCGRPGVMRLRY